jgi:hypothetical protein
MNTENREKKRMTTKVNTESQEKIERTTNMAGRQPAPERRLGRDAVTERQSDSMAAESMSLEDLRRERVMALLLGDDSEENRRAVAEQMYLNYAAHAYASYLREGRGALVGPLINGQSMERVTLEQYTELEPEMQVVYFPLTAKAYTEVPELAQVKRHVESYDPENEIVGIVHPPGGTAYAFVFSKNAISPRKLHLHYGDSM